MQLGRDDGTFYHSPVIVGIKNGEIYVATHTYDSLWRPLSSYVPHGRGLYISSESEYRLRRAGCGAPHREQVRCGARSHTRGYPAVSRSRTYDRRFVKTPEN